MNMHSLLRCLKAIEHICTQERSNAQFTEKGSMKNKKENKKPSTESTYKIPKKSSLWKVLQPMQETWGHIYHTQYTCCRYKENRNEKSDFWETRKGSRDPIPQSSLLHNYARKWTSLSRWSRNKTPKGRNVAIATPILTLNRELGRVA